jgi:hypothetical protein
VAGWFDGGAHGGEEARGSRAEGRALWAQDVLHTRVVEGYLLYVCMRVHVRVHVCTRCL